MIKSMTGFGKSELRTKSGLFACEIRTVNHKFLEITPKLPNSLGMFDDRVKNLVKQRIKRGKVYLNFIHESKAEEATNISINENLAKNYCNKLQKLRKKLKLEEPIKLSDIISFPGVINYALDTKDTAKMWPHVRKVINETLTELIRDREREGSFLATDLVKRIHIIKSIISDIKKDTVFNVEKHREKLSEKIKELSQGYDVDKGRIEMEVALFAKNSDVTEELTRVDNHIRNFNKTIRRKGEVGKKLDFVAQELHREANTIGSKSSGFNISKGVIEIKTELEKIREQLKNIE